MYYDRYNKTEDRLILALSLIWLFKANTDTLVKRLEVSRPTLIRMINELKRRGFTINSVRDPNGWHYEFRHLWGEPLPTIDRRIKMPGEIDHKSPGISGDPQFISTSPNKNAAH
jgi:hypothetical protein